MVLPNNFHEKLAAARRPDKPRIDLRLGDSAKVLESIPSLSIDMVMTSPPYDDLRTYNGYSFDFEKIAQELTRVLKPGGVIVWVVADATIDGSETGTSFRQALYFKELGLNLHDTMIWDKECSRFPSQNRYYSSHEYMFVFSRGGARIANLIRDKRNIWAGTRLHGTDRESDGGMTRRDKDTIHPEFGVRYNVWRIYPAMSSLEQSDHPAIYPFQLVADHIKTWSNPEDTVLDPFLGSGTTGLVAASLERKFIGIEISEEYFNLARNRIKLGLKSSEAVKS